MSRNVILNMSRDILFILSIILLMLPLGLHAEMENVSISGKIDKAKGKEVQLSLQSYIPGIADHISTFELDESNNFTFVAYIREPLFGHIFYGKEVIPFYVEPGSQLQISFDGKNPEESIHFSGDLSRENQFLVAYSRQYELSYNALQNNVRKLSPEEYISWASERRNAQTEQLENQLGLSETFKEMELADIEYGWANELYEYGSLRSQAKRKKLQLPDNFYDFADEIRLHNYQVISLQSYRQFLRNYLDYFYQLTYQQNPSDDSLYYNHMYKVAQYNLRSQPRYHMQAEYLVEAITYLGLDAVADEYIEFANECPVQEYKNQLHELIKMQNVFEEVKPKVLFTTSEGQQLNLDDLKGSMVLVRFDNEGASYNDNGAEKDKALKQELEALSGSVTFVHLKMRDNHQAYESLVYADATDYLKSIINRPKPGQKTELPAWSYVVLNREGLVVSNSLDDPNNELALEKVKLFLSMDQANEKAGQ